MVYGPTESAKTFLVLDLALCIATGRPWCGSKVEQGTVAYILAEGRGQIAQRCLAWQSANDVDEIPDTFKILPEPQSLVDPNILKTLLNQLESWDPKPKLVVVDTLAWCLAPGDENSTQDMSTFVSALGLIRDTLNCTVLVVHHTGRNLKFERGSTALRGAVDTAIKITRKKDVILAQCDKQRDGQRFEDLTLRLVSYEDSAALLPSGISRRTTSTAGLLINALKAAGPDGSSPLAWRQATKLAKRTFYRHVKELLDAGMIRKSVDEDTNETCYFLSGKVLNAKAVPPRIQG